MKADLQTDRVIAQNFKDLFLEQNKPWLKANLHELLTPRTTFVHRDLIVKQLGQILDPEELTGSEKSGRRADDEDGTQQSSSSVSLSSVDFEEARNPLAQL